MTSATDNQTTEQTAMGRFRAALEKRGIDFETNDDECAEGEERTTVFKANLGEGEFDIFVAAKDWYIDGKLTPWLDVEFHNALTPEQAIAATLGRPNATGDQESIVRSFLRKISPSRDWDYLGEHEHALIAGLVDDIALTLGDEAPKKCSTCQYRYVVGQRPYPTFGYMCGFGDGKKLCGRDTGVLDHMCCEHWEKELR